MHRRNISNHRGRQRRFSPRSYLLRPSDFLRGGFGGAWRNASSCCRKCAISNLLLQLREAFGKHRHIGDIRGRGLFIGMEFTKRTAKTPFAASNQIYAKVQRCGICRRINGLCPRRLRRRQKRRPHTNRPRWFHIFTPKNTEELIAKLHRTLTKVFG